MLLDAAVCPEAPSIHLPPLSQGGVTAVAASAGPGDPEAFPGQPTGSPGCPGSSWGLLEGEEAGFYSFLSHTMVKESSKIIIIVYLGAQTWTPGPGPSLILMVLTLLARTHLCTWNSWKLKWGIFFCCWGNEEPTPGLWHPEKEQLKKLYFSGLILLSSSKWKNVQPSNLNI